LADYCFFCIVNDTSNLRFLIKTAGRLRDKPTMKAKKYTKETIREIGQTELEFPKFKIGDTVSVSLRIKEGAKERLQAFVGDVIAIKNNGASSTFIVRKIAANSIAVEKIIPFYSPCLESVKVVRRGRVRRAKLYYLRDRIGKAAKVKELVLTKEEQAIERAKAEAAKKKEADKRAKEAKSLEVKTETPKKVAAEKPKSGGGSKDKEKSSKVVEKAAEEKKSE
jgi:large subunit ribosomal protein L19